MDHDEADRVSTDGRARTQDNSSPDAIAEDKDLTVQLERTRALEAEFRAFADSARDFAFITLSLDKSIVGWSKGAELLLGYSQQEAMGQSGAIFFTPEDVEQGAPDEETTTALREGRAEGERWHMRNVRSVGRSRNWPNTTAFCRQFDASNKAVQHRSNSHMSCPLWKALPLLSSCRCCAH